MAGLRCALLLVAGLEIADHLRKYGREVTDDLSDVSLVEALSTPGVADVSDIAERRLAPGILAIATLATSPALSAEDRIAELALLSLEQTDDLRKDRKQVTHDLVHVLLGEVALAEATAEAATDTRAVAITKRRMGLLRLVDDQRQQRNEMANDLTDVLLRDLSLPRRTEASWLPAAALLPATKPLLPECSMPETLSPALAGKTTIAESLTELRILLIVLTVRHHNSPLGGLLCVCSSCLRASAPAPRR